MEVVSFFICHFICWGLGVEDFYRTVWVECWVVVRVSAHILGKRKVSYLCRDLNYTSLAVQLIAYYADWAISAHIAFLFSVKVCCVYGLKNECNLN
jgi:hypothetical protein